MLGPTQISAPAGKKKKGGGRRKLWQMGIQHHHPTAKAQGVSWAVRSGASRAWKVILPLYSALRWLTGSLWTRINTWQGESKELLRAAPSDRARHSWPNPGGISVQCRWWGISTGCAEAVVSSLENFRCHLDAGLAPCSGCPHWSSGWTRWTQICASLIKDTLQERSS